MNIVAHQSQILKVSFGQCEILTVECNNILNNISLLVFCHLIGAHHSQIPYFTLNNVKSSLQSATISTKIFPCLLFLHYLLMWYLGRKVWDTKTLIQDLYISIYWASNGLKCSVTWWQGAFTYKPGTPSLSYCPTG